MKKLNLYQLLGKRILVTRTSARQIHPEVIVAMQEGDENINLDLTGVEGMTPSFLDEMLKIIESAAEELGRTSMQVVIENSPTQLTAKFDAVGRGHALTITKEDDTTWILKKAGENPL